ncbi:gamma-interferon-inducible lysosomal thiol reductase [Uranotaenia lowii]|uniref:gamma-interferon-inducible lysosomal thiol reductase n=1 Tax=Uranotaenia lowii TaxID=190385 RepID=UPI00247A8375|nr:gamma-interferon-inducible lysosomal thiol reductase [Uranotaenia lowii]
MMQRVLVLFLAVAFGQFAVLKSQTSRIRVAVYYEHLCPDSIRWFSNQLSPNYAALEPILDIEFIPFGKARSINGGESFECQHGPLECEGNRIQSCVLNQLNSQDAQVSYTTCQMHFLADPRGWECAFRSGVDLTVLQNCVDGSLGTQLQLEAERRTQLIAPAFVPTMVFNGQFNQNLQDRAFNNFLEVMCDLSNNAVSAC